MLAVGNAWTRRVYRRLARRVADDIADYLRSGFEVVEIVGVGGSPSCGVSTTLDLDRAIAAMARIDATTDMRSANRDVVIDMTRTPDSGPRVVGVRGPACWAGGLTTMKRHRHTPEQIVRKLREGDRLLNEGKDLAEVLRHFQVSESSWNRWRNQYGGMKANEAKRLRELESENARLKKLLAEAELDKSMLKELAEGNF
jgi:transposase-like protein